MTTIKEWLNESPGAAAIEREEREMTEKAARPFDPRVDVTADARYIVSRMTWNLVLWFLIVPGVVGAALWIAAH